MHESATSIGKILVLTCGTKDRKVYLSNAYRTNASFSPGFIVHLTQKKESINSSVQGMMMHTINIIAPIISNILTTVFIQKIIRHYQSQWVNLDCVTYVHKQWA